MGLGNLHSLVSVLRTNVDAHTLWKDISFRHTNDHIALTLSSAGATIASPFGDLWHMHQREIKEQVQVDSRSGIPNQAYSAMVSVDLRFGSGPLDVSPVHISRIVEWRCDSRPSQTRGLTRDGVRRDLC